MLNALRPYHSLLLLQDAKELAELMPLDCNSAIKSISKEASPSKSITTLAADTGISKNMVSRHTIENGYTVLFSAKNTCECNHSVQGVPLG